MYCIKCGVELSNGQPACPLCGTKVYHPDLPQDIESTTYPRKEFLSEEFNRRGLLFAITIIFLLPLFLPLIFEFLLNGDISWSGYVAGAVILFYVSFILPFWFRNANPVIFLPCVVLTTTLYLLYINWKMAGSWFFSFALPVSLSFGVLLVAVVALLRYLRRGRLYIFGGGMIALGAWTVLLECLVRLTFEGSSPIYWSIFSCSTAFVLGMLLIIIAIVKPWRESLRKMFFIGKC